MNLHLHFSSERQGCTLDGAPFVPRICLEEDSLSMEHNAIVIRLDAAPHSLLNWKSQVRKADFYTHEGYKIVWELDMGIEVENLTRVSHQHSSQFGQTVLSDAETNPEGRVNLTLPRDALKADDETDGQIDRMVDEKSGLTDECAFLARGLALDFFLKNVWNNHSLGVIAFRGSMHPMASREFGQYLRFLFAPLLEEEIPVFLLLEDCFPERDSLSDFILALKGKWQMDFPYAFPALAWDGAHSSFGSFGSEPFELLPHKTIPLGLLLSGQPGTPRQKDLFYLLSSFDFRSIPEKALAAEWQGVDDLVVDSESLTPQGLRKVLGFHAAGGRILTQGPLLSLPNEISVKEFLNRTLSRLSK